eukprot:717819-Hanusia_phi.AAC.1
MITTGTRLPPLSTAPSRAGSACDPFPEPRPRPPVTPAGGHRPGTEFRVHAGRRTAGDRAAAVTSVPQCGQCTGARGTLRPGSPPCPRGARGGATVRPGHTFTGSRWQYCTPSERRTVVLRQRRARLGR